MYIYIFFYLYVYSLNSQESDGVVNIWGKQLPRPASGDIAVRLKLNRDMTEI